MSLSHLQPRRPAKAAFSWGRVVDKDAGRVDYRLFRRLASGALVMESHTFDLADVHRPGWARVLRWMRQRVRWTADRIDLEALGLTDTTPEPRLTGTLCRCHLCTALRGLK